MVLCLVILCQFEHGQYYMIHSPQHFHGPAVRAGMIYLLDCDREDRNKLKLQQLLFLGYIDFLKTKILNIVHTPTLRQLPMT